MIIFHRRALFFTFFLCVGISFGQHRLVKKGDESYNNYAYATAISFYEKAEEKGFGSVDMYGKLADSYYYLSNMEKANIWYKKLFDVSGGALKPQYYLRYYQALKAEGQLRKADSILGFVDGMDPGDPDNDIEVIKIQNSLYNIMNLEFNSRYSDFAPAIDKQELVFTSARDTGFLAKNRYRYNDQPLLDLYRSPLNSLAKESVSKFSRRVNSKYNESTAVFSRDGETMYFTRNAQHANSVKKGEKVIGLKIFKAVLINGNWENIEELPFNSDSYSTAHPALSPDEKRLYFSSDMPGSHGSSDLYYVDINEDGTYGEPVNLGNSINTQGRESFPFISKNNTLFFSSDGHKGYGQLDLYATQPDKNGHYKKVLNLGKAVNGPYDDFTLILSDDGKTGFFASNRPGGMGDDDIYMFQVDGDLIVTRRIIAGLVTDVETDAVIANAQVTLLDPQNNELGTVMTDAMGNFLFSVDNSLSGENFLNGIKEGFYPEKKGFAVIRSGVRDTIDVNLKLIKMINHPENGYDLGKLLDLGPIYFDFDRFNIREDAMQELDKVVATLRENPDIKIQIRSHTDRRGSMAYNDRLSGERARSTLKYMLGNGIDESRLSGIGYGERFPAVKCRDCSEKEHALNRRSEFIITNKSFYTVQIGAFKKDAELPDNIEENRIFSYLYDDDLQRFYSGIFTTREEAEAHKLKVRREGYKGAFVRQLSAKNDILE